MAKTIVSRQKVDENNELIWEYFEIEEAELLPGEEPLPEVIIEAARETLANQ